MALMKKLTSAIVASSLVLGLVGTAGATTPEKTQEAAARMHALKLVQGVDPSGFDLALNTNITRAQLVTVLVRAFGQDANAKYLEGASAFSDTANHPWASGYIALAKRVIEDRSHGKEVVGYPDGSFNPDGNVTSAEAVAFLMKFLGVSRDTTQSWPMDYINGAFTAGFITAEDKALLEGAKDIPATRGLAFYLADSAFSGTKLAEGGTVYTTFVKTNKPTVKVDEYAHTTQEAKVTITGTVSSDVTAVYVGSMDHKATLADGKFTFTVDLKVGENNLTVTAVDLAGNTTDAAIKITHSLGDAATIEAEAITVAAGQSVDVASVVKDSKGNEIAGAEVTGESAFGTLEDGVFTAGTKAGEGTITLKAGDVTHDVKVTVTAGALAKVSVGSASIAPSAIVMLAAQDEYGNAITSGVTFAQTNADVMLDGTSGAFMASKAGSYDVTATQGETTVTATIGVYGKATKLVVSAGTKVIGNNHTGTDGTAQIVTVNVVDEKGNLRGDSEAVVTLTGTGLVVEGADGTPNSSKAVNGVATFEVYAAALMRGQIITLTASAPDLTAGTGTIEVVAQVATSVSIKAADAFLGVTTGGTLGYTVKVLDQAGKQMRIGNWDAKVTVAGPAYLGATGTKTSDTVTAVNGATTGQVIQNQQFSTGAITLTATVDGIGTASATVNAVVVGNAKALKLTAADDSFTAGATTFAKFTAKVLDGQGAALTGANSGADITLDLSALSAADLGALAISSADTGTPLITQTGGKYTISQDKDASANPLNSYTFYVATAGKLSGDLVLTVTKTDLTSATVTVAVNPGAVTQIGLTSASDKYLPVANPTTTLSAQLYDAKGNPVKKAGVDVVFTAAGVAGAAPADISFDGTATAKTVKTDADGKATVTVTAKQYVSNAYTVTATSGTLTSIKDGATDLNKVTITIDSTSTASLSVVIEKETTAGSGIWVIPSFVEAGDTVRIRANVTDSYGVARVKNVDLEMSSDEKVLWTGTALAKATGKVAGAGSKPGEYLSASFLVGKAGLVNIKVTEKNAPTTVAADAAVLVYANVAKSVVVAEANSNKEIFVAQNSISSAFTMKLVDLYGNEVSSSASIPVGVAVSGVDASKVHVRATADGLTAPTLSARSTVQFFVGVQDLSKTVPVKITFSFTGGTDYVLDVLGK